MQYRVNPKNGDRLSALGLGCMRLPRRGGQIDMDKACALIESAIERGVNYFDTAYIYQGSEKVLGTALKRANLRDKVNVATKLPLYFCKSGADFERLFTKQLERLQTDRIDYYLMHMLTDMASWQRLLGYGITSWLAEKKREGRIVNAGFSFHGGKQDFKALIDAYDWDFCMIQYNYFDEQNQAGREGLCYASQKCLPVFVMEPLRGGMLVNALPDAARKVFTAADSTRSLAEWGLRWVWNQPEVTLLLSGMGEISQLDENVGIAETALPNTLTDLSVYEQALTAINSVIKVPCTGCGYCMPCEQGVDIPTCFSCYNESFANTLKSGRHRYFMSTGSMSVRQSRASQCIGCRKCEAHCPQGIEISRQLPEAARRLEAFWLRPGTALARKLLRITEH